MRLRFKVIEVGWGIDFDNNRHPRIRIGRRNWSAVLYDHPAEGWQVISLEIACKAKRDTRIDEYDGDAAGSKFREFVGGEMVFTNADVRAIENDLYEVGRKGAARRWVGKTITLSVDKAESWHGCGALRHSHVPTCVSVSQSPVAIRLQGTRYDFVIETTPAEREFWFELRAIHRASECWSVVNTVNAVMAELLTDEQDSTDPRWVEVPWGISPEERERLVQTAYEMLNDERCLAKIEDALDEDRAEGEWRGN